MDSDTGYFLIIVFGLPLLLMLLTGPAMWSEKWGWSALDRIEQFFKRAGGSKPAGAAIKRPCGRSPRPPG
ncbi:MAG TPA: hypothetical protein VFL36_05875 [Myxococcales bacterium]|nr:hypothetical protein [Myxococcales bacterium]